MSVLHGMARWLWPAIILASVALASALLVGEATGPLRQIVLLWTLAVCPGMAWVRAIGVREPVHQWVLAIGMSFALVSLTGLVMVYTRWAPVGGFVAVGAITWVGVVVLVVREVTAGGNARSVKRPLLSRLSTEEAESL